MAPIRCQEQDGPMLHPAHLLDQLSETGSHQQMIEAMFEDKTRFTGTAPVIPYPLIVIAFTNRCGSNYLGELMRSTGKIAGLGEGLNADAVANRAENWGIESFPEYFLTLAERHRRTPFGFKASWDQLLMLIRLRITDMYTGLRVIHIRRNAIVAQAVSRDIAWQTGKWTSLTKVEKDITPRYDARSLTDQIAATQTAEALFPLIFDAFELDVIHVDYETLVNRTGPTVRTIMESIGTPCPDWTPPETRVRKQADQTNDDFRARYRDLLRRYCLDQIGDPEVGA
jgi:LPS sulfotransferase NodH